MALIAARLNAGQCGDRYIISLSPHLHTPVPPSLLSLMASVDVKLHVYLLPRTICPQKFKDRVPSFVATLPSFQVSLQVSL